MPIPFSRSRSRLWKCQSCNRDQDRDLENVNPLIETEIETHKWRGITSLYGIGSLCLRLLWINAYFPSMNIKKLPWRPRFAKVTASSRARRLCDFSSWVINVRNIPKFQPSEFAIEVFQRVHGHQGDLPGAPHPAGGGREVPHQERGDEIAPRSPRQGQVPLLQGIRGSPSVRQGLHPALLLHGDRLHLHRHPLLLKEGDQGSSGFSEAHLHLGSPLCGADNSSSQVSPSTKLRCATCSHTYTGSPS